VPNFVAMFRKKKIKNKKAKKNNKKRTVYILVKIKKIKKMGRAYALSN